MALKRKRNLKVDNTMKYSVCILHDLKSDELEDYVETRDTGMEADEEKEIHLQKIMQREAETIPLPRITTFVNPAREVYAVRKLKRRIKWSKDCTNTYIEDEADRSVKAEVCQADEQTDDNIEEIKRIKVNSQINKINNNNDNQNDNSHINKIVDDTFKLVIESRSMPTTVEQKVLEYVLRRTLIRYEVAGLSSYVCFRPRIFNPSFKPRRNELLITERLNRLGSELGTLTALCKALESRIESEKEKLKIEMELLRIYNIGESTKNDKRTIRKYLMGVTESRSTEMTAENVHRLMCDRERIRRLRMQKISGELFMEIECYKPAMEMMQYYERVGAEMDEAKQWKGVEE